MYAHSLHPPFTLLLIVIYSQNETQIYHESEFFLSLRRNKIWCLNNAYG